MTVIQSHIRSLECYVEQCGGCVVRELLPEAIHGGMSRDRITLRTGLDPYEQLLALVHELTHWLAHRDAPRDLSACVTIYEYEAEAVENLVMGRLGLPCPAEDAAAEEFDRPTDGLLTSSVTRVRSTVRRICQALELEQDGSS
jgi:Zn-dependent peptidase ImmA (M78 family)